MFIIYGASNNNVSIIKFNNFNNIYNDKSNEFINPENENDFTSEDFKTKNIEEAIITSQNSMDYFTIFNWDKLNVMFNIGTNIGTIKKGHDKNLDQSLSQNNFIFSFQENGNGNCFSMIVLFAKNVELGKGDTWLEKIPVTFFIRPPYFVFASKSLFFGFMLKFMSDFGVDRITLSLFIKAKRVFQFIGMRYYGAMQRFSIGFLKKNDESFSFKTVGLYLIYIMFFKKSMFNIGLASTLIDRKFQITFFAIKGSVTSVFLTLNKNIELFKIAIFINILYFLNISNAYNLITLFVWTESYKTISLVLCFLSIFIHMGFEYINGEFVPFISIGIIEYIEFFQLTRSTLESYKQLSQL